jgi:hypothetical protein
MVASVVNIRSNNFKIFPKGILGSIKFEDNEKIRFTNNTVYDIGTDKSFSEISNLIKTVEMKGNHFPCECSIRVLQHDLREFSQNNFCISKCNISLSDLTALIVERKLCALNNSEFDEYDICASVINSTPDPRRARAPSHFTTPITTNIDSAVSSSERTHFMPVLLSFMLFAVIYKS